MTFKKLFLTSVACLFVVSCQSTVIAQSGAKELTSAQKTISGPNGASSHLSFVPAKETLPFFPRGLEYDSVMTSLAFGSCANQDMPQPIWKTILNTSPHLFVFMGDNVYASSPSQKPLKDQYAKMDKIPEYISIREKIPFMAIWDDHDYGQNDGGFDNPDKEAAKNDFLSYWRYVKDATERKQEGLYHAKIFGPSHRLVQVIMLDTRWNRSPLVKSDVEGRKFEPTSDKKASLLGEAQWKWLEQELNEKADIRFIVSSIQLIPNDHGFEKWGNFPAEKERFFDLLRKTKSKNVVILSGDRHIGAVSKLPIPGYGDLFEITSSSINKPANIDEKDLTYLFPAYNKENFGLAQIDWDNSKLLIELRNINNEVIQSIDVPVKLEKRKIEVIKPEKKKRRHKKNRRR